MEKRDNNGNKINVEEEKKCVKQKANIEAWSQPGRKIIMKLESDNSVLHHQGAANTVRKK